MYYTGDYWDVLLSFTVPGLAATGAIFAEL